MFPSAVKEDNQRRRAVALGPPSRTLSGSVSGVHHSRGRSAIGSACKSFRNLAGASKLLDKNLTPRHAVRVFDEDGNDVTPRPLYQAERAISSQGSRFFLDDISAGSSSDPTSSDSSLSMPFSRSLIGSSQTSLDSLHLATDDTLLKQHIPISFPDVVQKRDTVTEDMTEDMLDQVIQVCISETDSISLLDIPSTSVSEDANDAEAVLARNNLYTEFCSTRIGNDKYMERSAQTLNGPVKNKQIQTDCVVLMNSAMDVSTWDLYDTLMNREQHETVFSPEPERVIYPETAENSSRAADMSVSVSSSVSSASAASSLACRVESGTSLNPDLDLQLLMTSENFQYCLQVMERSILGNISQPNLAAYRLLPVLEDSDVEVVEEEEQVEEAKNTEQVDEVQEHPEGPQPPAVELLWVFSCKLNRGQSVNCMAWNKKNPDLLAVGYGDFESSNKEQGLVCCWSLKNPMWPDQVIHCDSPVTSLDFSFSSPSQLAVGMLDGTIAIYSLLSHDKKSHSVRRSESTSRHLGPVWQLRWVQQDMGSAPEKVDSADTLFSVSADGRISKWILNSNGLDCIDLMKLRRVLHTKRNMTEEKTESVLSTLTAGMTFDFNPADSSIYLVGTSEGLIYKCSCSNSQHFLETYKKHFCPVNCVSWSPLSPDVFLSCSSDWTIQLWKQDHLQPILEFISNHGAVHDIKWSPRGAVVFGVISEGRLEIWDLSYSILEPSIVQPAAPTVDMRNLLFSLQTDCVLVGDSDGQVSIYQLKNIHGMSSQGDVLDDIISSAASK